MQMKMKVDNIILCVFFSLSLRNFTFILIFRQRILNLMLSVLHPDDDDEDDEEEDEEEEEEEEEERLYMTEDEDDLFQELLGPTRRGFDGALGGPESGQALPVPLIFTRDRLIRAAAADAPRYCAPSDTVCSA